MAVMIESWVKNDLKRALQVQYLQGMVFSGDNDGNLVGVEMYDGGEPAALAGSVSANVIRADGTTVAVTGTLSDGYKASVVLPQACYAVPGVISIIIKLTDGETDAVTTLGAVVSSVYRSTTDTVVDPGDIIPSVQTLIAAIETAVGSIPADYSSLWTSLAPAYSTSATYAVGAYVTHNGGLYRCITAITAGESWTSGHWTAAKLGPDLANLKSALEEFEDADQSTKIVSVPTFTIEQGNFTTGGQKGTSTSSTYSKRIRTAEFIQNEKNGYMIIDIPDGWNCAIYKYLTNDASSYTGNLVYITGKNYYQFEENYIRIMFGKVVSQTITPEDFPEDYTVVTCVHPTDKTLTQSNKAADAKAVGDKIGRTESANSIPVNEMQFQLGKYYNNSGVLSNSITFGLSQIILVKPGDVVYSEAPDKDSDSVNFIAGFHSFRKTVWLSVTRIYNGDSLTIPDGVDSIRVVFGRSSSTGIRLTMDDINTYAKIYVVRKNRRIFEGKRVSLIGTSDSTFAGYIPSENRVYYSGENYGVYTVGQCWWHIGITENGGLPLINDSWSGSTVVRGLRSATDYRPLVETSRCQNLHAYQHGGTSSDTLVTSDNISLLRHSPWDEDQTAWTIGEYVKRVDPDVVIINGGGNDYVYSAPMGTYNGHTELADDDPLTSFREAYATLINRIQSEYPYALVICCTPIYLVRPSMSNPSTNHDKNQVNLNSADLTYYQYQEAIKEIATMKGCPVVDGFVHGFSRYNYYNLFSSDSDRNPVHPNALGHMVFGEDFAKNLKKCVTGLIDFS